MATGAVQYVLTGAGYDTGVSIVSGGSWGEDANVSVREGIGGVGSIVAGMQVYQANIEVLPADANCLLDKVLRSSYPAGPLASIPLEVGDDELGIQDAGWLVDGCEFGLSVNEALFVRYDLVTAGKPTRTLGSNEVGFPGYAPLGTTAEWYKGSVSIGGADYQCRALTGRLTNNLFPRPTLDSRSAGTMRYVDAIDVGPEEVEVTAEFHAPPGHDLSGDDLATASIQVQSETSASPSTTITFSIADARVVSWSAPLVSAREPRVYVATYRTDVNSGSFSITMT